MAEPNPRWVSFDRSISFVSWCHRRWPIIDCYFRFSFVIFFPFFVASSDSRPTPALYPSDTHAHKNTRLLLPITLSLTLVLVLLLAMAFLFRFLRKSRRKRGANNQISGEPDFEKGKDCGAAADGSVRKFTWAEINEATANFSRLIGSGGFSNVFLARFPGGSGNVAAVKVQVGGDRLNQNFKQEVEILLRLRHYCIVKLLGFCDDPDEAAAAMVFDYIPKGNLQEKLNEKGPVLPWRNRTAIAFQLAQAIEYLHEKCSPQIVHGDIKASNVLLDEFLNCKLCDFGSAKMGFSSTVLPPSSRTKQQLMIGSPGYTDPHYLRTGIASKKNDVYSFGVIILELVTGKEAFCSKRGKLLTSIMEPMLKEIMGDRVADDRRVAEIVDPRLGGQFELQDVKQMVTIAALCLHKSPSLRPSATQIQEMIKEAVPCIANYHKQSQ